MKHRKKWLFGIFYSVGMIVFLGLVTEVFVRRVVLARGFKYIDVHLDEVPQFRLKDTYKDPSFTIREGRREFYPRMGRSKGVAFVGDSVTFCATVKDKHCFVEQLQNAQSDFDAYNYGVPGYGLQEVREVVRKIAVNPKIDLVLYTFNFNDVHPASAVLLSLLKTPSTRFASVYTENNFSDGFRRFVKDHIKLIPTAHYFWGVFKARRQAGAQVAANDNAQYATTPSFCLDEVRHNLEKGSSANLYKRAYPAWQKLYRDPKVMNKMGRYLTEMRDILEEEGKKLLVQPFHDLVFYLRKDRALNDRVLRVWKDHEIDHLDTYNRQKAIHKECSAYADPGHPGNLGNRSLSQALLPELLERLQSSNYQLARK